MSSSFSKKHHTSVKLSFILNGGYKAIDVPSNLIVYGRNVGHSARRIAGRLKLLKWTILTERPEFINVTYKE